jgi:hypothetical protein
LSVLRKYNVGCGATTFSITTFRIMTFSIKGLFATLSIMTISITAQEPLCSVSSLLNVPFIYCYA